ncbi:hypothetical protein F4780DRAFT_774150 [Xylariomycetidae sp. FL0641]|nr:hypothetical protein F4780DRAFT_774150 [Xylariomycetidae sp. FL0641]
MRGTDPPDRAMTGLPNPEAPGRSGGSPVHPVPLSITVPTEIPIVARAPSTRFPLEWNLYHPRPSCRVMRLGVHECAPWFVVSPHGGCSGQPDIILHSGPSDTLPALAAGWRSITRAYDEHSVIVLPPLSDSDLDSAIEVARMRMKFLSISVHFTIETGDDPGHRAREIFEWRHSYRSIRALMDGVGDGWKLVRLGSKLRKGGRKPSTNTVLTSDGYEVVAMWAFARKSLTKALKFRFLGNGASGTLGDRWELMAVITALRMYQASQKQVLG